MARKPKGRAVNGLLILDKPLGLSSNAALQRVKRLFNAAKAGHTGSLDPLATGVLPLCLGEATKFSQYLLDADKAYSTVATLGIKTTTGDAEGEAISEQPVHVTQSDITQLLPDFTGEIQQVPPMYSALKHKGQPLYKLAREGKEVERPARTVTIKQLSLESYAQPDCTLNVECTKGTYIRTLVEDIGDALNCGAHVSVLRRTKAGPYTEAQSYTLEALEKLHEEKGPEALDALLLPLDSAAQHWPAVRPGKTACFYLQQGQPIQVSGAPPTGLVRLYTDEQFIGIGEIMDDGKVAPKRLIAES